MDTKAAPSPKATKGFTLMELIIVLALLAIIAAILIPMFLNTTDRARLRSDIQSTRVIQNAVDLYRAERGAAPGTTIAAVLERLADTEYISPNPTLQTEGALWHYDPDNRRVTINLAGSTQSVRDLVPNLSEAERQVIMGGSNP